MQVGLETACLLDRGLDRSERRVDRAVEHHGPHMGTELLGIEGAEVGPVRETEVGELPLPQRDPQAVHVPSRRCGIQVREHQSRGVRLATGYEPPHSRHDDGHLRSCDRLRVDGEPTTKAGRRDAVDRSARPDAAGVEAHEVESLADLGRERRPSGLEKADAGDAGPPGFMTRSPIGAPVAGSMTTESRSDPSAGCA